MLFARYQNMPTRYTIFIVLYHIKWANTKTEAFYLNTHLESTCTAVGNEGENQTGKQQWRARTVLRPVSYMTFKLLKVASEFGSVWWKHLFSLQVYCMDFLLSWIQNTASEPCLSNHTDTNTCKSSSGGQQQVRSPSPFRSQLGQLTAVRTALIMSSNQNMLRWGTIRGICRIPKM